MSDIIDRLEEACKGYPAAWPHRLLHDAISEIERLRGVAQAPIITDEMVERGKHALHIVSTYRGYNEETLAREYSRMEGIYEATVRAILKASLVPSTERDFPAGATGVGLGGDTQREQNPSALSSTDRGTQ